MKKSILLILVMIVLVLSTKYFAPQDTPKELINKKTIIDREEIDVTQAELEELNIESDSSQLKDYSLSLIPFTYKDKKYYVRDIINQWGVISLYLTEGNGNIFTTNVEELAKYDHNKQLSPEVMLRPPASEEKGLNTFISDESYQFAFMQQSDVCADACIKGTGPVEVYYRDKNITPNWQLFRRKLPFGTPNFTNYAAIRKDTYLYLFRTIDKRNDDENDKNEIEVYRTTIFDKNIYGVWEELPSVPFRADNAYGLQKTIIATNDSIFFLIEGDSRLIKVDLQQELESVQILELPGFSDLAVVDNQVYSISIIYDKKTTNKFLQLAKVIEKEDGRYELEKYELKQLFVPQSTVVEFKVETKESRIYLHQKTRSTVDQSISEQLLIIEP